ncbi:MAG: ROK family transcriptional regulator [Spirochaetes bacterium]|nr:ROK family transcriptional regulator [Spirochaetota bacterium]MBU0956647.1 ROK family transcriptional regulator [Spirochaetota bacterium]
MTTIPKNSAAARILRCIWKHPRSSRVVIADRLGLDKSTVTNQVSNLIGKGIIEEIEEGESSVKGGRKPIHLGICKSYGRILGIELQAKSWVALEVDLAGNILAERRGKCHVNADNFVDIVQSITAESHTSVENGFGPLLGVGVGTGGLIDSKQCRIRYSVPLAIYNPLELAEQFAFKIPVPCFVENDANCCAWGELAFARSDDPRNFIFALVEYRPDVEAVHTHGGIGVGFGIVLGGKVYMGSHGNAGEFRSAFCDGSGAAQFSLPAQDLARVFNDREVLEKVCDEFSRNLALLVNTMDFEHIFIGGDIEEPGIDFLSMLRRRLEENWMYPFPKNIEIRYSSLGGRAVAYGAAGMLLDKLFSENLLHDF